MFKTKIGMKIVEHAYAWLKQYVTNERGNWPLALINQCIFLYIKSSTRNTELFVTFVENGCFHNFLFFYFFMWLKRLGHESWHGISWLVIYLITLWVWYNGALELVAVSWKQFVSNCEKIRTIKYVIIRLGFFFFSFSCFWKEFKICVPISLQ